MPGAMPPKKKNRNLDDWEKDFEALDELGNLKEPEEAPVKQGGWAGPVVQACSSACCNCEMVHAWAGRPLRCVGVGRQGTRPAAPALTPACSRQAEEKGQEERQEGSCIQLGR